jgi:hypothetical protein
LMPNAGCVAEPVTGSNVALNGFCSKSRLRLSD